MVANMTAYRDARTEMQKLIDNPHKRIISQDGQEGRKSVRGSSEDEAENLLGGSQGEPVDGERAVIEEDTDPEADDDLDAATLLDKDARRELLRSISLAANESVKAAEEKMGLAATAYNGIDRHIRRLDADISKLESSILLGLRTGTEESRGAREALGLPVDDDAMAEAAEGGETAGTEVRTEAETAALTKAAGAANRRGSASEKRITRTAAKPATSPTATEQRATRSRSRSASASATAAERASPTAARATRQKTSSPAPARSSRKRKPQPLSPQKGGRRSVVTTTPTVISPTTQLPRDLATLMGPDVSDMPIDPTEPTYCYCGQVSYDEMVACDNDDCTIEWFHYACVGLTRQPKKEWFCRFCAPKGWKGEGMEVPSNAIHKPPGWKKATATK
uniref:Chromatin modification-related protein n=2 Tax=Kalmanozyma brasiliensis (strain GHG001) TaxID=1365824 RepID=V5EPZ8_KALBG